MSGDGPVFPLVATDLDGTLLRSDQTVSARTRAALARVAASGAAHIIVTGRSVAWALGVFEDLGYEGLAVCGQGAQVYDAGARRLLTSITLDRAVARLAVEKASADLGRLSLAVARAGENGGVLAEESYAYDEPLPIERTTSRDDLWAEPVLKLFVQPAGSVSWSDDDLAARLATVCAGLADVMVSGPGLVELVPTGLTKAVGLSLAARRIGLRKKDTIAFGDMPNDVPMLRWAAYGVAMAGAHPSVLEAADEVAPGNDDDGVAAVLERLYPE